MATPAPTSLTRLAPYLVTITSPILTTLVFPTPSGGNSYEMYCSISTQVPGIETDTAVFTQVFSNCKPSTTALSIYAPTRAPYASLDMMPSRTTFLVYYTGDHTILNLPYNRGTLDYPYATTIDIITMTDPAGSTFVSYAGGGLRLYTATVRPGETVASRSSGDLYGWVSNGVFSTVVTEFWDCRWETLSGSCTSQWGVGPAAGGGLFPETTKSAWNVYPAKETLQPVIVVGAEKFKQPDDHLASQVGLFPFAWIITANANTTATCSSAGSLIMALALENVGSMLHSIVIGNRKVTSFLTRDLFCKESSSRWKKARGWLLPFSMQILSSVAVAVIVATDHRYTTMLGPGEVILFLSTRPRASWIGPVGAQLVMPGYVSSARSGTVAEAFGQALGLYICSLLILELTAIGNMIAKNGDNNLKTLYAGAVMLTVANGLTLLVSVGYFAIRVLLSPSRITVKRRTGSVGYHGSEPELQTSSLAIVLAPTLALGWISSWVLWAGFINFAGSL